jgi:REP element-mobilizing transposase RayT
MIRSSLEETGNYRVLLSADEPSALVQLKGENCTLAMLDMDLGAEAAVEIGRGLRSIKPDLKLIILSDEDIPVELDALRPWVLLRKPFYLPELFKTIASLNLAPVPALAPPPAPMKKSITRPLSTEHPVVSEFIDLPWLKDVNKAAQRLTRLTLESSAQAALITRGKTLWAYAGQFSQDTANELVLLVTRNWDEQKGGDLLRFARLETTRAEHMLYATTLAEGTILAMVFDAETPFSTIRSQANSLARSLSVEKTGPVNTVSEEKPRNPTQPLQQESTDDTGDYPSIADIISDIPTPTPRPHTEPIAPVMRIDLPVEKSSPTPAPAKPAESPAAEARPSTPLAETRVVSRESSPPIPLRELSVDELDATVKHEVRDFDATRKHEFDELAATAIASPQRPLTPVRPPQPGELDETKPHSITEVAGRVILESTSAGMYQLNYACLLVPRFSSHYLTGDLAERLGEWFPNICVAFGWRLEFLAIRPEYMQWVISVPPNTSPGYLMRIMRQQTSEKIFSDFPRLKRENPSGDFWAPGYLIMGGTQPHPQQLVKDYIKQTRQRQGISEPRR